MVRCVLCGKEKCIDFPGKQESCGWHSGYVEEFESNLNGSTVLFWRMRRGWGTDENVCLRNSCVSYAKDERLTLIYGSVTFFLAWVPTPKPRIMSLVSLFANILATNVSRKKENFVRKNIDQHYYLLSNKQIIIKRVSCGVSWVSRILQEHLQSLDEGD